MTKIFITGSADGLGLMAAKDLLSNGHQIVFHARNEERAASLRRQFPQAAILIGDLSDIGQTKKLAEKANALGTFDAIIHNAGVYQVSQEALVAVNVLAPYILTCLMHKPKRLIYLSSDMHLSATPNLDNLSNGSRITYSDTKFHVLLLTKAVARKWPNVLSNAMHPGWVPTKMGGASAPDDLRKGFETQVWLAESEDADAKVSGQYFFHKRQSRFLEQADDIVLQDELLAKCEQLTGVKFPG